MVKSFTTASCCLGGTTREAKYASRNVSRSTSTPQSNTLLATRENWLSVGFLRKTCPVCKKPIRRSPNRTGTAVSESPLGHEMLWASSAAISVSFSCTERHDAHARLRSEINEQNGPSFCLP